MKNKIIKKLILLIVIFIIANLMYIDSIKAVTTSSSNITIESNKQILEKDEQIEITVHLEDRNIAAFTIYLYYDTTKLEYISSPENSNHINHFVVHTGVKSPGDEGKITIAPFIFKTLTDNTITSIIVTGEFYNQNGEKIEIEDSMLELQIGKSKQDIQAQTLEDNAETSEEINGNIRSDNTNLKILRLEKPGMTPAFSKDIKEYYFTTTEKITSLQVTAIPENSNSVVTITGNNNLKTGTNVIQIQVESEDKTRKEKYNIYVTKTNDIEKANTNLENLAVRQGNLVPEFDTNITNYTIEIDNSIDKIDILAVPENMNATVEIKKEDTLKIGDNNIEVIISAEDGKTKKRYIITAHRRTTEEQTKYEEQQKEQEEKLNIIIEQTALQEESETRNTDEKKENKIVIFIVILISILTSIIITKWIIKKKSNNKP